MVHSTRRFVLPCVILFLCFSPFSIAITSLGEERANLNAFSTFVRIALVWFWFYLFTIPLGLMGRAPACDCGTPWTFLLPFFFFFFFFVNYYDTLSDIMIFCLRWRWPYLRSFVSETL